MIKNAIDADNIHHKLANFYLLKLLSQQYFYPLNTYIVNKN
jgi:hypothetical protein